ncbi:MAG: glycosyl hydrolase [Saprospiraceae bacterium]|nr:glycosyl hydrolase [Saprospiraceae bacterium]
MRNLLNLSTFVTTLAIGLLTGTGLFGQTRVDEKYYRAMEWRHIGPFRGGRSCAIKGVPSKPNLFYMGTTGGGVWKTTDAGMHWDNISDGYFGGSIGAVEVAPSDPNVVFAGEGEQTIRGNVSPGRGIWRSEDGGKSWKHMGLAQTRHIARIRCHPANPDIALVAALGNVFKSHPDRGIYKTTDGGRHWKLVLHVNDSTGAVDLSYDPSNPRIAFASTWNMRRTAHSMSSGGPGSGLWRSTDGGDTWVCINDHPGLPKGTWGICGVAVSPSNNDVVYALIENEQGGLYRSDDAGKTWRLVNGDRSLRQRAWYFSRLCIHPSNPDEVYVLNVSLHRSTDGGKRFSTIGTRHADNHDMWIHPDQPSIMAVSNDGGGQISLDGGKSWSPVDNQPTAQFYRVTTDRHDPFRIYAAQQDNSTIRIAHRTSGHQIGSQDWEPTAGGESGHIAVDPRDPDIVYGGSYGGYLNRYDHRRNISRNINVWPDNPIGHGAAQLKYRFQWNFPLFFSPHDPNKLYCASNRLHVTDSEGQSWRTISPDLTRNDSTKLQSSGGPITQDNTSVEYYCTLFAAAESPRVANLLWVGSDDGLIHVSRNGGDFWQPVRPKDLPIWIQINSIEPDPHEDGGCYVAATAYKNGDFKPYLYRTKDFGKTWTKIVGGIPDEHFTRVLRADPVRKGLLYAGTEYGIYVSFDDGANWRSLQLNLPIVPITDLHVKASSLVVATQGRSLWIMDDLGPLRQIDKTLGAPKTVFFEPKPMIRMDGGSGNSRYSGTNHPNGIVLFNYFDTIAPTDTVSFLCLSERGDTVSTWSNFPDKEAGQQKIELKTGSNRLVLNPRGRPALSFDGMVLWWSSLSAPKPRTGNYHLFALGKNFTDTIPFQILPEFRYGADSIAVAQQFEFIQSIRDRIDEAHRAIMEMRDIRKQLNDYCSDLAKDATTDSLFLFKATIDSSFEAIENALYQTKSKSGQDPINFPIKLTNKLAHLIALHEGGSYPPTDQAEALRQEVDAQIAEQLALYRELCAHELRQFNRLLRQGGFELIYPRKIKP